MSWLTRGHLNREQLTRAGLAVALVAAVLVAAFGVGYRSSAAMLGNASAWLQQDNTVVRVNAETGDVDAEAAWQLATGEQRLEVVQLGPDKVYVLNNDTGELFQMPTDTLRPESVDRPQEHRERSITGGGGTAYLLDNGVLTLLEGSNGSGPATVKLQVRVDEVVVDSAGTAWALAREHGQLFAVDGAAAQAPHQVADPGEPARLTLVADTPVVYLPERGRVSRFDRQGPAGPPVPLSPERPATVAVNAADHENATLAIVVRPRGELILVDLAEQARGNPLRTLELAGRAGNRLGPPVISGGRVYVPDYTRRHVVVVQLRPLQEASPEPVPGKHEFDLFVRDGRVWANDPYAQHVVVFDHDGRASRVDKITGQGAGQQHSPTPTPGGSATPSPEADDDGDGARTPASPPPPLPPPPPPPPSPTLTTVPEPAPVDAPDVFATCGAILDAGLECDPVQAGEAASRDEIGRVVSLSPETGTTVPEGTTVEIRFLAEREPPPDVFVPNLIGMSPDQACAELERAFLECRANPNGVHPQTNIVYDQAPVGGAAVASGTAVTYVYATRAPVPLYRYKVVNQPAWRLRLTDSPNDPNLQGPNQLAGVYSLDTPSGDPNRPLVIVYERICRQDCGVPRMFHYAASSDFAPNRPRSGQGSWEPTQPLFQCLRDSAPGSSPLVRMFNPDRQAWTFAIQGNNADYQDLRQRGYREEYVICHVW